MMSCRKFVNISSLLCRSVARFVKIKERTYKVEQNVPDISQVKFLFILYLEDTITKNLKCAGDSKGHLGPKILKAHVMELFSSRQGSLAEKGC